MRNPSLKEIHSVPDGDNQDFPLTFTNVNTNVHAHFHTHIHTHADTHTHTWTHMNMHPYTQSFSLGDNDSRPQVKKDQSGSREERGTQTTAT